MAAENIENILKIKVKETLSTKKVPELIDLIETDNIGEVIEKLVILHIRMWMLEDKISLSKNNNDISDMKKKLDICFKIKRPKFVQAINLMIDKAIKTEKSLIEDSVKLYQGHNIEKS